MAKLVERQTLRNRILKKLVAFICSTMGSWISVRYQTKSKGGSVKHNQTKSPLLRLPAELRNQIWEYVFTGLHFKLDLKHLWGTSFIFTLCYRFDENLNDSHRVRNSLALL
ncbi:hypothetical protein BDV96DRAFT_643819 [Lophiotrema nucula]|uniref:Uncharacterized protein n=1 Tax=Lophiotrema nucula TaxID=690887 RepID=A0A6A5ZGF2_9PLEO|nr:hypothetical protein BDV96DRAFT_643819 [Lophiotrema nucula]